MSSKKFPGFLQWKQLFKVLKGTERKIFLIFTVLAVISATYLAISFYIGVTKSVPAFGGTYTEGIVGQPRFINPIYGETNDVDRTIIGLVFSGLMTYDKDGIIINDLAESYQISEDGKTYTFQLKNNLFWQDGVALTADDIVYTIETIQDSSYKSPLRANWLNIQVQKNSEKSVSFFLSSPYNSFLESCTVKIIPQHVWKNVLAENATLSSYNLQPVGSGPYVMSSIEQTSSGFIKNVKLTASSKYYAKSPYISTIIFSYFSSKEELVKAANQKTIDGFSLIDLDDNQSVAEKQIRQGWSLNEKFAVYSFTMPRYFAVFFNTQSTKILSDSNIAKALNYSVDKQELAQQLSNEFKKNLSVVDSPILPNYYGYQLATTIYNYDTESANALLDKSGYKLQEDGTRAKANTKTPAFQFKSYLKQGSSGNEVIELQGCLSRLDENFKSLLSNETSGKYGKGTESAVTAFQEKYLPDVPSTGETGPGTRKKLNELCLVKQDSMIKLKFKLVTINQPQLVKAAEILKDYWQKVGVAAEIEAVELSDLKDIIKDRDYDALLYGEALGSEPDLYPFWHSTQINDPGLNLSLYQNKKADQFLKSSRETQDFVAKAQAYESLQDIILADAPALFLYNPDYIYWVSEKINGIDTQKIVDPAKRFSNIQNWYIKTKRTWK